MDKERKLTLLSLQEALAEEVETIAQDMLLKRPDGELAHLKAYRQHLPILLGPDGEIDSGTSDLPAEESEYGVFQQFPWALVQIRQGTIPRPGEDQTVYAMIIFGIFEDSSECKGHEVLMILFERMMERFLKYPLLAGQFTVTQIDNDHLFNWLIEDSNEDGDTHPFYFGGFEMAFQTPAFEREDPYGFA